MNPGRFFLPNMGNAMNPMIRASYLMPSRGGIGIFGRIASSLRTFNWSGLLNGANKTLNVVNQTIPLVRQAGPMLNNMKSMLRIAKAFGSETNNNSDSKMNINKTNNAEKKISISKTNGAKINEKEVFDNNYPNFFV